MLDIDMKTESYINRIQNLSKVMKSEYISVKYRHKPGYGLSDLYQGHWRNITSGLYISSSSYMSKHFLTGDLEYLLLSVRQMDDTKRTTRFDFTRITDMNQIFRALKYDYEILLSQKEERSFDCSIVLFSTKLAKDVLPVWGLNPHQMDALARMRTCLRETKNVIDREKLVSVDNHEDYNKALALIVSYFTKEYDFVDQSLRYHLR